MIRRIVLENFMSHRLTELELADGLTVLVGPNNCGKSAVVTALKTLCELPGRAGDYMLRHGAPSCRVEVQTDDGHTVAWMRKGAPSLEIDGEVFTRLANDRDLALQRLHAVLRLPQVPVESGEPFDIHFGEQKSPVFLLNEPASRAAVFFAASSDAERLLRMQSIFKERIRAAKSKRTALQADLARMEENLARLSPLEALQDEVAAIQAEHERLEAEALDLKEREHRVEDLAAAERHAAEAEARARALEGLQQPPVQHDVASLETLLAKLREAGARRSALAGECRALLDLSEPPNLEPVAPLETLVEEMSTLAKRGDETRARLASLDRLEQPPDLEKAEELEELCDDLDAARRRMADLRRREKALAPLVPPPQLKEVAPLEELCREMFRALRHERSARRRRDALAPLDEPPAQENAAELQEALAELHRAEQARAAARKALEEADDALRRWIAEHPVCPFCGGKLDPERLTESVAEHAHG